MRCKNCKSPIERLGENLSLPHCQWVHSDGITYKHPCQPESEPESTPEAKEPTPSGEGADLRSSYYKTSDGVNQLLSLAERIKRADPAFHYRVKVLEAALDHLKAHMDSKYNWD